MAKVDEETTAVTTAMQAEQQHQPTQDVAEISDDNVEAYLDDLIENLTDQMNVLLKNYSTPQDFDPVPSDVFIVSWMKSGTTLMQNLVYQLMVVTQRVPTDPEGNKFRDISMVVPFIEMSPICGVYQSVHPYQPAAWKSHTDQPGFSKPEFRPCHFIYLLREGKQVVRSFLDFMADWLAQKRCVEDRRELYYHRYFLQWFLGCTRDEKTGEWKIGDENGWWFSHVKGWMETDYPNVLIVLYEDLIKDLSQGIRTVAAFLGVKIENDDVVRFVLDACDQKKMANDPRFSDIMVSEGFGLDVNGGRRVRKPCEVGFAKYELTEECNRLYDEMFMRTFGVKDYATLAEKVRKRNAKMRETQGW